MAHRSPSGRCRQVGRRQQQLVQEPRLPFAHLLDQDLVKQALRDHKVSFRDRLFSPLVTLWVFLSQVIDPDHSCRAAVARFWAWRAARKLPPCSTDTGAYCKARKRLPEGVLAQLTRSSGRRPQDQAPPNWRWKGRNVKLVDGTTVSMPDTDANQQEFPQPKTQKPGLGFPIARLVVLFSLTVATVLDAALGPYKGKQTGETSLWHTLYDNLEVGDILLADRYYGSFWELALTKKRGADLVSRLHQRRKADFRLGQRLGKEDHVVDWSKPPRPDWMDEATYASLPAQLAVREVRVRVQIRGFRTRMLVVVTTLLDPLEMPRQEVAILYRIRWQAELDLRALKETLAMDVLRCQSPEMVRKEVWAHLLAYNVIRNQMAQAAKEAGVLPVQLSFKGAVQGVNALAGWLGRAVGAELEEACRQLRALLASYRIEERPNRSEPRARKRRPKHYPFLKEPRRQSGTRLAEKTCA
jgi:DDE family transposase